VLPDRALSAPSSATVTAFPRAWRTSSRASNLAKVSALVAAVIGKV
jgi:hypothetical protein